jgi:hypothetical protein
MLTLKEIDSQNLLFDIHDKSLPELMEEKFCSFSDYVEQKGVEKIKVARFICLISDKNSPLRFSEPDWYKRKYTAAIIAGFSIKKGTFSSEAESIIVGENKAVNETMVSYIASYGMPSYMLLMSYTALMAFEAQKIFNGKGTKDSSKIVDNASNRIQELTRDFFQSGDVDEYSKVCQTLYSRIEKERERLKPEEIIKILEDTGDLPEDFNPHGTEYKIDLAKDMIFIGDK